MLFAFLLEPHKSGVLVTENWPEAMTINPHVEITAQQIYDGADGAVNLFSGIKTHAPGREGMLPITPECC